MQEIVYYNTCEDMPLYNFIKVAVYGNLEFLVKGPGKPDDRAADIFSAIMEEYNDLSGSTKSKHVLSLLKDITVSNNKLIIVQNIIDVLIDKYVPELCDILREQGFKYEFSKETIYSDLKKVITSAKRIVLKRDEAQAEYNRIDADSEEATEKDYLSLIVQLSRFLGYKVDSKQTSVLEFTMYVDQYNKFNTVK